MFHSSATTRSPSSRTRRTLARLATTTAAVLCFAAAGLAHAHGFKVGDIQIDHPYAPPTGAGMKNGAVFFHAMTNAGKAGDQLISASSPVSARTELHRMEMQGDIMRMRELPAIDLPAGAKVDMKRGAGQGYHVMLMDLKQPLKVGDRFPVKLKFKTAGEVEVQVVVEQPKADGAAGGHGAHGGHSTHKH